MKILQSFYLTLLIVTVIANLSSSSKWISKIDLYEFQPESMSTKMAAKMDESEDDSDKQMIVTIGTGVTAVTSLIPGIAELTNAVYAVLTIINDLEERAKSERKSNAMANAIIEEISNQNVRNNLFTLDNLMSTVKYGMMKANQSASSIDTTDTNIFQVINTFANVKSPFHKCPSIAVPILLALPTLVEPFMQNLATPEIRKLSRVPCNLADTLETYFKPTLLNRLLHINVEADYFKFATHNKYVFTREIAEPKFDPNVTELDDVLDCMFSSDDNNEYEQSVKLFGGYKMIIINSGTQFEPNKDKFPYSYMKDGLGDYKTYFYERDVVNGNCVRSYFQMVRSRLERAFADAYNKVNKFCTSNTNNGRLMVPTGRGLLTITVGALLAKGLPGDNVSCDGEYGWVSPAGKFCDPYVKITVGDTVYFTKKRTDAPGWISLDETFNFPNLVKSAKIRIEILDSDTTSDDVIFSRDFNMQDLVSNVLFQDTNYKLLMVSTWKPEIGDTNFQVLVYPKN